MKEVIDSGRIGRFAVADHSPDEFSFQWCESQF